MRRLVQFGAGVAVSSAAFLTLWQLYDEQQRAALPKFRLAVPVGDAELQDPADGFQEQIVEFNGGISLRRPTPVQRGVVADGVAPVSPIDLIFEPLALEELLKPFDRPKFNFPIQSPGLKKHPGKATPIRGKTAF